ncbi:type II secretion system protein GspH [Bordetella avium]|uniref:Type II secretion system protein H n=2 Tax=Bordetella avium TaxID=521 RepID=Q2KZL9_BORA1|nr:GspH/FimT family pseudopilin [Bordetella avium]AZY50760.1 type II secretion system protein GspH [Bordetella avium]AZY54153.1 type II secretion system protein GspH [Bordetella avium]RIQ15602.1 type II secretion system protein GspH [Bordetella avium]RIQ18795.1 type II secretion system protein GspH [Bordetella avium]RIQ35564.1 type II secretion system protein GspH [Bordetella avium]
MQTSAPGRSERGFTLLEMLVVLVIVGMTAGMVTLAVRPASDALLEDARRLERAFTVAQGEALSDGRAIRWRANNAGWAFERDGRALTLSAQDDRVPPPDDFSTDEQLRPMRFTAAPVSLRLDPERTLTFNTEWVAAPFALVLESAGRRVELRRDPAGNYDIR